MGRSDDQYSDQEAQRRFLGTLKAALNTPPKPLKDMPPRGVAAQSKKKPKKCPECAHVFQGNGWDGIDAHWRSKRGHEKIMPYDVAWPLIKSGTYKRKA